MAVQLNKPKGKKKRKRYQSNPKGQKLFLYQQVEVRSMEEGFLGSWHVAVITGFGEQRLRIEYNDILNDDGFDKMVEWIPVSPAIDGVLPDNQGTTHRNYRGNIRPLPPSFNLQKWFLNYGQCVDVFHQDAWWEGVIFDHDDGSDKRKVFFPDMGDEMITQIEKLRITQEWDEVTEEWKARGTWLFLELIEEVEREWPLLVSVKQIWYELQLKKGFENLKEWTSSSREIWKQLLLQVLFSNFKLTMKQIFRELISSGGLVEEGRPLPEFYEPAFDAVLKPEAFFGDLLAIVPYVIDCQLANHTLRPSVLDNLSFSSVQKQMHPEGLASGEENCHPKCNNLINTVWSLQEASCFMPFTVSNLPPKKDHIFNIRPDDNSTECSTVGLEKLHGKLKAATQKPRLNWLPVGKDIVPEAVCCPSATTDYINKHASKLIGRNLAALNARRHLSYLGWKMEFATDTTERGRTFTRMRYTSPCGIMYYSLRQACLALDPGSAVVSPIPQSNGINNDAPDDSLISSPLAEIPPTCMGASELTNDRLISFPFAEKPPTCMGASELTKDCLISSPLTEKPPTCMGAAELTNDSLIPSPFTEILPNTMGASELISHREYIKVEQQYCPRAVMDYSLPEKVALNPHNRNSSKVKGGALKAKKHLSAVGWKFFYCRKGEKKELRYEAPVNRKVFYSLRQACKWWITEGGNTYTSKEMQKKDVSGEATVKFSVEELSSPPIDLGLEGNLTSSDGLFQQQLMESSSGTSLLNEHALHGKFEVHGTRRLQRKRKRSVLQNSSALLQKNRRKHESPLLEEMKDTQDFIKLRDDVNVEYSTRVLRSSKRARQVIGSSSTQQSPRTILSWLIDSNVVLPRAKVHYRGRKDGRPMKEGRITREGIKCICCQNVFTLSKFEAHAGSTYHRPSANIFLEDGRSLFECQLQLKRENNTRNTRSAPRPTKGNRHGNANDYICSICHYGGELVLCDQCPSSFHTSCLGLKEVPDGDWYCPSCCCGICSQSRFNRNSEPLTDGTVLNCGQCEHQYHVECLRNKDLLKLDSYPEGIWFCNKRCEQTHYGLQKLLGKPVPVGLDNLTWTLLKYTKPEDSNQESPDNEQLMDSYSKLNVALSVMHECFEPVKEPRTRRDLVEDVIFSRWSELNRLNFQGFYTVLLERDDELITAATIRVYGEKVAEIPLVATRFQYRRLGMCRILMNELEKKLMELGVERLVLPAVPSVLNTWTTSFGFSIMKESERLNFLDYTFLDFQGTVMCQKLLNKNPSGEFSRPTEIQQKLCEQISKNDVVDLEGNSAVSEVFQADRIEESEIVDQGSADLVPQCLALEMTKTSRPNH